MWPKSLAELPEPPDSFLLDNGEPTDKGRGYEFSDDLIPAVDVAIGLGRPLLVSGEPGCGKTELGYAIARRLGLDRVYSFTTRSNSEARDLFYLYDALGRFRDAQVAQSLAQRDGVGALPPIGRYIDFQALGRAILDAHPKASVEKLLLGNTGYAHPGESVRSVVIIDEIDKAPRDFPNDLLREIEDLSFRVPELGQGGGALAPSTPAGSAIELALRPIIIVASNEEKQLPDAFLRRCIFQEISFPSDRHMLRRIVASGLAKRRARRGDGAGRSEEAEWKRLIELVLDFRKQSPEKLPGLSELIDAAAVIDEAPDDSLEERLRRSAGTLAKLKADRQALEALLKTFLPPTPEAPA